MKMKYLYIGILVALAACSHAPKADKMVDRQPVIFPDYANATIPSNIAPLNFKLVGGGDAYATFAGGGESFSVHGSDGCFEIPASKWKKMLKAACGKEVTVSLVSRKEGSWIGYESFKIRIAAEPVDGYIAYRLIAPGYSLWSEMGIYQRNLESYDQTAVLENKMSDNGCMNCHSFCMQNPDKMLFHMRAKYPGTMLINGNTVEKLNTKTDKTISALVYPSWHPSGKYIAFSVNKTNQAFHLNDRNRIEVFDEASDVVVYDVEKHEIVTSGLISSAAAFETFPTFSPDGRTLYFCSSDTCIIPKEYKKVKYSLCSISFDPAARSFGTTVDTLYNAHIDGHSASFPRVSPDGRYLMFTLSGYGNFSIWHKDADLYLIDLASKQIRPLNEVNSKDAESYHSWSSNSRWFVFGSRRLDGLYTRPFIAYIGKDGKVGKPFLVPQKNPDFYSRFMKSYNIPEFVKGKVKVRSRVLALKARNDKGIDVKFAEK